MGISTPRELGRTLSELGPGAGTRVSQAIRQAYEGGVLVGCEFVDEPTPTETEHAYFVASCSDLDGCYFYVIPKDRFPTHWLPVLQSIDGAYYADDSDFEDLDGLLHMIRFEAMTTSLLNRDPGDLARDLLDGWEFALEGWETHDLNVESLARWIGALDPFFVRQSFAFHRPLLDTFAVTRAS